jgi:hypothetical protein
MPERWLSQLQKIDRVEPTYGLLERAEAGPSPSRDHGRRRGRGL